MMSRSSMVCESGEAPGARGAVVSSALERCDVTLVYVSLTSCTVISTRHQLGQWNGQTASVMMLVQVPITSPTIPRCSLGNWENTLSKTATMSLAFNFR